MRWIVALFLAASLAACKGDEKAEPSATATGAGTAAPADAAVAAPVTPVDAAPAPPPPPPEPAKPTLAEATAALTAILTKIGEETGVALMHGCAEGEDRVAALFEQADESAVELQGWMADEKLRGELAAVVKDRSDPALAAALAKLDTDVHGCKGAPKVLQKGIDRLLTP